MNVLILRSIDTGTEPDEYSVQMNTAYAERMIGHLTDTGSYCSACGNACIQCRSRYDLDFSDSIVSVIDVPAVLPVMIDDPEAFFPAEIPEHDILICISVHEELIISFVKQLQACSGVVIPIEETEWISSFAKNRVRDLCAEKGMECAFPKPFCSFAPQTGALARFREQFRIGRPEIEFSVRDGVVEQARVVSSAPCGATYFVARSLETEKVNEELLYTADLLLSSYPCTAGHSPDPEFNDSITHQSVKIQRHGIELSLKKENRISV